MMFVCGPIAYVVDPYVNQPTLAGTEHNTAIEIGGENFWEQREYVELHAPILAGCGLSDKRLGTFLSLNRAFPTPYSRSIQPQGGD
jgi:hypothetical protein